MSDKKYIKARYDQKFDPETDEIIEEGYDLLEFLFWGLQSIELRDPDGSIRYHSTTVAFCKLNDGTVISVLPFTIDGRPNIIMVD